MAITYIKKLKWEERAVSGECPICGAAQGEPCRQDAGNPLDAELGGGAHVARLVSAPTHKVLSENTQEPINGTTPTSTQAALAADA